MSANRTETTFSADSRASLSPEGTPVTYDGDSLVFVVGCPRSGTTWLQRLLASHPKIRTGQESHLFQQYIGCQLRSWRRGAEPRFRGGVGMACYFTEEQFLAIIKTYLLALIEPMIGPLADGELFLEKSPSNGLYLPEIFELLPKARVIHLLRDARDVVSSLTSSEAWLAAWKPRTVSEAAGWWAMHVKAVQEARPTFPPHQFHEVTYEDLSQSPVEVLRGCAEFLGLEWDPAEVTKAVERNQASKARASGGGSPIPLSGEAAKRSGSIVVEPDGFIRKAKVGSWRNDLSLLDQLRVWRAAHKLMEEVGYGWSMPKQAAFRLLSASVDATKLIFSPR